MSDQMPDAIVREWVGGALEFIQQSIAPDLHGIPDMFLKRQIIVPPQKNNSSDMYLSCIPGDKRDKIGWFCINFRMNVRAWTTKAPFGGILRDEQLKMPKAYPGNSLQTSIQTYPSRISRTPTPT
ncbi:hypothetical protein [Silvimonas iriomotensis]|uniref:hypothetical protein n=1 Tax=Silvimonas iriomotensis TaxID=449662 RepID=UPI00166E152D|nr:hypothetical protein [Silvimonas iriomotensis]